ncbi:MAG: radical SAM family heme chaperone HemW [Methylobacter sp.]|nr:radical SAM family heme chaperone HemW [Methylobacter sp.]
MEKLEPADKEAALHTTRRGYMTELKPARRGFITNYPNFQHWKKSTGDDVIAPQPLNIYVHIPFCAQQCSYCYYKTIQGSRKSEVDQYVDVLCQEIELATRHFHLDERPVRSIYFGGGTPTLLSESNIAQIAECLRKNLTINADAEFTVEAEPVTLTQKKADLLRELNVNRVSLGVQSLCDDIIKLSNRKDTEQRVMKAIEMAQSTGASVNIDLMSGLAGETSETWAYSIRRALESKVESITVYKTELYANTEYYKEIRNDNLVLPTDEQELELMQYALDQFAAANYLPWSFFTFTRDGNYEHVHAPSIWKGEDYYPFGTSAFGRVGNWLFQNSNDIPKYFAQIEAKKLAIVRGHKLTALDLMVRELVLGMKLMNYQTSLFEEKFGFQLEKICAPSIDHLITDGYATLDNGVIALTQKGMLHGDYAGKSLGQHLLKLF